MTAEAGHGVVVQIVRYAAIPALLYIACMLSWIGWEFIRTHPQGAFRVEVFSLVFFVLFGPGTFSLIASAIAYAVNRTFPIYLQVTALISAVWVGYIYAALEEIRI